MSRGGLDSLHERAPVLPTLGQHFASRSGERVIAAAALAGLLHPSSGNQSTALETIEHGIERRGVERDGAVRPAADLLRDLIAVAGFVLELRQDQQFRRAFLERLVSAY